jgi:hypothetical protein
LGSVVAEKYNKHLSFSSLNLHIQISCVSDIIIIIIIIIIFVFTTITATINIEDGTFSSFPLSYSAF